MVLLRRNAVPGLLCGALLVGSTVTSAALASSNGSDSEAPTCSSRMTAATSAAAAEAARDCGLAVESLEQRTEFNTNYALPDGSTRLEVSAVAVRARDGDGWSDVDNTLVPGASGVEVAAAVSPMTFSDGSSGQPLATVERDGHVLSLDVPFDLPAPELGDGQLVYSEVLPGVDLVLTVSDDTTTFTEVLRVESPQAAADPRLAELRFPVQTSDGLQVVQHGEGFQARDGAGEPIFSGPPPTMWDSSGPDTPTRSGPAEVDPSARAVAPIGGEDVVPMELRVGEEGLSVTPDQAMLRDPGTVWPVYIDPSLSGQTLEWTAVRTVYGQRYKFTPDAGVGLCNASLDPVCNATHKSRLLWEFGNLGAVGGIVPGEIVSATFSAVGSGSYDCTPRPVTVWRVASWDGNTPWPGGTYDTPQSIQTVTHDPRCPSGQQARLIEWSVLEAAQHVAASNTSTLALAIAVDESSMAHWKRYGADAKLSIVYNRYPYAPSQVRFSAPEAPCATGSARPYIRTLTPVIYGVHNDIDGGNVRAAVDVNAVNSAVGANVFFHNNTPPTAAGLGHSMGLAGLSNGGIYRAKLWTVDDRPQASAPVYCEFAVDTQAPNAPTVSAVADGTRPVYRDGVAAGGVAQPGSIQLGNNGSGDVVRFEYSLNSTSFGQQVSGNLPIITVTPTQTGTNRLYVRSVDRAGWTGPTKTYDVVAAWPQKVTWKLDETSGTNAASSGSSTAFPLTVSASMSTRVGGFLAAAPWNSATDKALNFDSSDDTARTTTAVVDTTKNFTVSAAVRPTSSNGTATALSQDGATTAGFQLGYRPCASGTGSCWSFAAPATDSSTAATRAVVSTIPVQAGEWAEVTGVHDAAAQTLALWVCHPVPADFEGDPPTWTLTHAGTVAHPGAWPATGPLQLGRASGTTPALWTGAVGEARTADGVLTEPDIRRTCPPVA